MLYLQVFQHHLVQSLNEVLVLSACHVLQPAATDGHLLHTQAANQHQQKHKSLNQQNVLNLDLYTDISHCLHCSPRQSRSPCWSRSGNPCSLLPLPPSPPLHSLTLPVGEKTPKTKQKKNSHSYISVFAMQLSGFLICSRVCMSVRPCWMWGYYPSSPNDQENTAVGT